MSIISFLMFGYSRCTDWAAVVTRVVVISDEFLCFFFACGFYRREGFCDFFFEAVYYCDDDSVESESTHDKVFFMLFVSSVFSDFLYSTLELE